MFIGPYMENKGAVPTMKDALLSFCGFLKMRKALSSTIKPRMQTITIHHASVRTSAFMAWLRITHSPTKHVTAEEEKMNESDYLMDQKTKQLLANKSASVEFASSTRD